MKTLRQVEVVLLIASMAHGKRQEKVEKIVYLKGGWKFKKSVSFEDEDNSSEDELVS